jgi:hypothetical protein
MNPMSRATRALATGETDRPLRSDRKIEVGFPRRFQRLVDARSLGGDGIADLT